MPQRDIFVWAVAPALLLVLLMLLVRRRLYRVFPFFAAYVMCQLTVSILRIAVSGNYRTFFEVYWTTEALYSVMALLALHEAFWRVFRLFYLYWWFWLIFPGMVASVTGVTIWTAFRHPPAQAPPVVMLILSFGWATSYIQGLLFAVFFLLLVFMELPWKSQAFGVVRGFGIAALGALLSFGLRSEFGNKFNALAKYGPPVAYILAVGSWLLAFYRRAHDQFTDEEAAIEPIELMDQVRQYTEFLREFLRRNAGS
jgi:hypothetical protein